MKFSLIQVGRGIAAMLVVLYHQIAYSKAHLGYTPYGSIFNFGFIGVDFFFVLSGFIITYTHFADLINPQSNSLEKFFKKRITRIYPIYWVFFTITLISYLISTPKYMTNSGIVLNPISLKSLSLLVQSFLLIPNEKIRLVGVAWTLSYELIFYLIFGIGIALGFRAAKLMALFWVVLILINYITAPFNNEYTRFFFNVIVLEFLMGCVVAYLLLKKIYLDNKYTFPAVLILLTLFLIDVNKFGLPFDRSLNDVLLMGLLFSLLTYVSVRVDQTNKNIRYPSLLLLIGDASYSIYLSHIIFLSVLPTIYTKLNPEYSSSGYLPFVTTIIFILVVLLGVLVHLFIEKKLLKLINNKLNLFSLNTSSR
jgi:exopolysaccharide production protein ExoZ